MMIAMLGMAVGTGNIWRFPRIAATNGGGSFLIPWIIFLFIWSIPLIITEFALGKAMRQGPVGAFQRLIGKKYAWMGAWVAFTATAIMFYYSVVTGWCLRFVVASVTGAIPGSKPGAFWLSYEGSLSSVLTHGSAILIATFVVFRGVKGIEKASRVLIPSLVVLLIVLAIRAVTLPGAERGLNFLFTPDWNALADVQVWLQALTQNAWDTGAGWGLIVTYAVYMRVHEDTTLNAFILGFGNNSISLLAGITVLCTIFSIQPDAASSIVGAGNNGLTFIWIPQLFKQIPAGQVFMVIFFLALLFAALTSLISMVELVTRALVDRGLNRKRAIVTVGLAGFVFGLPSALSPDFFTNQDAVWGIGLMVSGLFFSLAAIKYGLERFRNSFINPSGDILIGKGWNVMMYVVMVEAVILLVWWLSQTISDNGLWDSLNPWSSWSLGTVIVQWSIVLACLIIFNPYLVSNKSPRTTDEH